jgi:hypothetical protein
MVPFSNTPNLAHTMLSFGFEDGYHLALSIEIRREEEESFEIWKGFANQYELIYVLGDERDLIKLRTNYRGEEVYLYRGNATPEQAQDLLVDVLQRANSLAEQPEFYHALWNNCTTNIADHVNSISPSRVPYDVGVLLPGRSDQLAFDLGLLDIEGPFEIAKARAHVNSLAMRYGDSEDFSAQIRR